MAGAFNGRARFPRDNVRPRGHVELVTRVTALARIPRFGFSPASPPVFASVGRDPSRPRKTLRERGADGRTRIASREFYHFFFSPEFLNIRSECTIKTRNSQTGTKTVQKKKMFEIIGVHPADRRTCRFWCGKGLFYTTSFYRRC